MGTFYTDDQIPMAFVDIDIDIDGEFNNRDLFYRYMLYNLCVSPEQKGYGLSWDDM